MMLRAILRCGFAIVAGGAVGIACLQFLDLRTAAIAAGVLGAMVAGGASWPVSARRRLRRLSRRMAVERPPAAGVVASAVEHGSRWQLVVDALPQMIVYVDRNYCCQWHNRAFAQWIGGPSANIRSRPLREVIGDEAERDIRSRAGTLAAGEAHFLASWARGAANGDFAVTLIAGRDAGATADGLYVIAAMPGPEDYALQEAPAGPAEGGESDDIPGFDAVSGQLMGAEPKQHLLRALERDDFMLFAQEIRPLSADAPYRTCSEVLLRLREEEESMLPPGSFLPVAERYGLMVNIDRWVVRTLSRWCLARRAQDPRWRMPLYCVNVASASLCDASFARDLRRDLLAQNFPGSQLCFELAEADLVHHHAMVRNFTEALRPLGCRFALDGFGSTRTRYVRLKGLPLDFLKIDGSIIHNMLTEAAALERVRAIADASRRIGIRTIALHVESDATVFRLTELGVDYVQGFGIARPGPIADLS